MLKRVIGIDPGITGGLVLTDGESTLSAHPLPLLVEGKEKRVSYSGLSQLLLKLTGSFRYPVFLERAVSFGMGTKAAFNYGRGFEATVIAITEMGFPLTLVEPNKWTKVMHQGIDGNLKAKVKSGIVVKRLYPKLWGKLPANSKGKLLDGPVDALLIAGFGLRSLVGSDKSDPGDFY